jgi:hypothetical protein
MTTEVDARFRCDGACRCPACRPGDFPRDEHVLHAHDGWNRRVYPGLVVTLDGIDVVGVTAAARPGPQGWIEVYPLDAAGEKHLCRGCHREVCRRRIPGDVFLELGA